MRLVELLQIQVLRRHIGLTVGQRNSRRLLRPGDGFVKTTGFRAGVGEGLNLDSVVGEGQSAGARSQLDGFFAIAQLEIRAGAKKPRKIIQGVGKIRLKLQGGAVLVDGLEIFVAAH